MKPIDFWFSIGSTYTYLSVMRLRDVERTAGVKFNWRPFSVRELMQEMDNKPFIGKPAKAKYMWRDIQRRSRKYGIPANVPVQYPIENFDLANRIAVVAQLEGWCPEFVRASYQHWFQDGLPAGGDTNLSRSLQDSGQSQDRVIQLAQSDTIGVSYKSATSEARALGIFGSPTFVVDGSELFWGDDRLEDAVDYCGQMESN